MEFIIKRHEITKITPEYIYIFYKNAQQYACCVANTTEMKKDIFSLFPVVMRASISKKQISRGLV